MHTDDVVAAGKALPSDTKDNKAWLWKLQATTAVGLARKESTCPSLLLSMLDKW